MTPFAFPLDAVLAHRKRLEDQQQLVFAAAMQRVYDAEWLLNDYRNRRDAMRERIRTGHAVMAVDELRAAYAHCEYLDRAMVTQGALVADLRRVAERERTRLLEKTKDKKILQTLREQRHDAFTRAAATADQAETDEINARRFDRATAPRETTS